MAMERGFASFPSRPHRAAEQMEQVSSVVVRSTCVCALVKLVNVLQSGVNGVVNH